MRFVDREQGDARAAQVVEKALVVEALGRHVQQRQLARAQLLTHRADLGRVEGRVQAGGVDAEPPQVVDLVFHQRDERRHDQRDAVEHQRG